MVEVSAMASRAKPFITLLTIEPATIVNTIQSNTVSSLKNVMKESQA
jgi:hypothetical protein